MRSRSTPTRPALPTHHHQARHRHLILLHQQWEAATYLGLKPRSCEPVGVSPVSTDSVRLVVIHFPVKITQEHIFCLYFFLKDGKSSNSFFKYACPKHLANHTIQMILTAEPQYIYLTATILISHYWGRNNYLSDNNSIFKQAKSYQTSQYSSCKKIT